MLSLIRSSVKRVKRCLCFVSLTEYDMLSFPAVKPKPPVIQFRQLPIHQSLNRLFKPIEFLCSPHAHRQTKLRSARQLLDVLNQSSSNAFSAGWSSVVKGSLWQRGCGEVGIKWGSESTVGQSTSALSGLSIRLTPSLPDSAFSHSGLYKECCLSEGGAHDFKRNLIFLKSDWGRIKSLFVCFYPCGSFVHGRVRKSCKYLHADQMCEVPCFKVNLAALSFKYV